MILIQDTIFQLKQLFSKMSPIQGFFCLLLENRNACTAMIENVRIPSYPAVLLVEFRVGPAGCLAGLLADRQQLSWSTAYTLSRHAATAQQ